MVDAVVANVPRGLLSLPVELRLRIYRATLQGWHILVDAWCDSIHQTLALKRSTHKFGPDVLSFFHVNRQVREDATALVGECATLCFFRGPRSAWDRRWRTAGRPLPALLRENVRVVLASSADLGGCELPLRDLPGLREARFSCGHSVIDYKDKEWSRDWARYRILEGPKEKKLVEECRERCLGRKWVRELHENTELRFRVVFTSGIMFPDIRGRELKTVYLEYVCDFGTGKLLRKKFDVSEEDWWWNEHSQLRWTMPIDELWKLGDNSRLDEYVVHRS